MRAKYPSYFTTPCSAFEITEGPRRLVMERKKGRTGRREGGGKERKKKEGSGEKERREGGWGSGRKEGKMNEFWYRASPVLADNPWTSGTSSDSFFCIFSGLNTWYKVIHTQEIMAQGVDY